MNQIGDAVEKRRENTDAPTENQHHHHQSFLMKAAQECANLSALDEVSIIDNVTNFLEANAGATIDQSVLRQMAEALTKSLSDTSPGALQDVTMDNAYGVGYRSPCVSMQQYHGASSPAVQGRSVREFEEHTAQLRKENFNLKLRLYFVEQNMPALKSNGGDGCDTVMRELIDHKVEVEMLRRELEEKQGVLKDALQAIEDLENMQKETETNYEVKLEDLKQKMQHLEMERNAEKSENNELLNTMLGRSDIVTEHVNTLQKIRELEAQIKTHEDTISELQNKVDFFDSILEKREKTIQEFEDKTKNLEYQNAELQEELENCKKQIASNERIQTEIQQYRCEIADKTCIIEELEETSNELRKKLELAAQTINSLKKSTKLLQTELKKLRSEQQQDANKEAASSLEHLAMAVNNKHATSTVSNVDTKNLPHSLSDTDAQNAADVASKNDMQALIERQEKMIKSLQAENKKKTADLQNLVNNELWEKNREIERLTKLVNALRPNSPNTSAASHTDNNNEQHQSYTEQHEYTDVIERNKQLQRKIDILTQRLGAERENESIITKLRHEVREARADAECAEKFRLDCANACSVLTERLEELAGFLNSLLKNKDVLGLLAADRKRAMRKAIDRSLDLSKSLNRTLSITGVSLSEYSLSQLCNLSEILNDESSAAAGQLDEMEALNESKRSAIESLRAENKALKKELDKRRTQEAAAKKERRSLPASVALASLENQSESEAWSEPDRKVSLARMGLEDHSASLNVSKELSVAGKQVAVVDTDSESETDAADTAQLNHSRSGKLRTQHQETIAQLERLIAQRDERILQVQCQLVEVDNRLKRESLRVLDLTDEVRQLRERNEQLQTDLLAIGVDSNKQDVSGLTRNESMWLQQIEEQSQLLERIAKERDLLDDEARAAKQMIKKLQAHSEQAHKKHAEELLEAKEKERKHVEETRKAMETLMQQQLEEQQQQQKETLEQLTELQRQYVEAQRNIDSHIENAKELRQTLVESELNARSLKKQLDESALQATQAVMERSKALSEKLQLERAMNDYKTMLADMQRERDALQKRLEQTEAAALQIATTTAIQNKKAMTTQLNGSDCSQSGYTSEEVAPLMRANVTLPAGNGTSTAIVDAANGNQRLHNSSPDLGIESDAGRVSSVELTNMHRPLLMKIEVPSSSSCTNKDEKQQAMKVESLDIENRPPNANAAITTIGGSTTGHDCAKVDEENAELKRKLIRTKRQFEETYQKLKIQNQRKAQIEKDIKTQIIKTHHVLKNVRSNMDNEK